MAFGWSPVGEYGELSLKMFDTLFDFNWDIVTIEND